MNRATLPGKTANSSPPPTDIPKSKTWSVLSTIQKVPTHHNVSSAIPTSRPTTISSTIQSTTGILSPRHTLPNKGRTSISRLGKPTSIRQEEQKIIDPTYAQSVDGSTEQPQELRNPPEATTARQNTHAKHNHNHVENISYQDEIFLDNQQTVTDAVMSTENSDFNVNRPELVILKAPDWGTKNDGTETGNGAKGPSGPPRSKRSQQNSVKRSQKAQTPKLAPKKSEVMDEDISPLTSAAATPKLSASKTRSPVPGNPSPTSDVSAPRLLTEALQAKSLEACKRQDVPHTNSVPCKGMPAKKSSLPPGYEQRKPKSKGYVLIDGSSQVVTTATTHYPFKNYDIRTLYSSNVAKDADSRQSKSGKTIDHEAPVTCSLFPSPFRRNPSAATSPVRERISVFEALGKFDRRSPPGKEEVKAERPKPHTTNSDVGRLNNKKTSFAWIPKKLRRKSVHGGKDRKSSHASTDEGTRPPSATSEERQAKPGNNNNSKYPAVYVSEMRKHPDTASFTPFSRKSESRP